MTNVRAQVVGAITGGRHGWPFAGTVADLEALGLCQHEYLLEGTAKRYRTTSPLRFDGRWSVDEDGVAPYRTRVVVTAPTAPKRSNGTLLVEWNNVSAGFDTIICDSPDLLAEGYTHVGVTAQYLGVHGFADAPMGLLAWDPDRYPDLNLPGDRFSYDTFGQAARAAATFDPIRSLPIDRTVAVGVSQSAGRVATYYNAFQAIHGVFDAFLLVGYFGAGASIDEDALIDLRTRDGQSRILRPIGQLLRDDLGIPIFVVNSEAEVLAAAPVRQPDTETFRQWEVAGTPHTPPDMLGFAARVTRDQVPLPVVSPSPELPPQCATTWWPAFLAGMEHFQRWIHGGPPPNSQPLVLASGEPLTIERDELGIALGGVRLPEVDVPIASHRGSYELPGNVGLGGASLPFSREELLRLYPNRSVYIAKVGEAIKRAVDAGVLRPVDAARSLQRAEAVDLWSET